MSADDFQTKYASVMESMLKSAVAETTKLFETMVDELKAEISRIKKENEDLKSRCSRVEGARSRPTDSAGSEPPPGPNDGSEKRDTATQCDLVPFHMMLVEQCQPLRHSSLHNQKQLSSYEGMEYILQDHNYDTHGEGDSQMGLLLVKQESVLKEEETESTVVSGQALSDKADSLWASGTDHEGPLINKISEEPNDVQKKTSVSLENCTTLRVSPTSGYVLTSAPSKELEQVFEKSTIAIHMTEPSAVSGIAGECTSDLDKEIRIAAQDCALPNEGPIEEKLSDALLHLTSITSKDTSDPHFQMTKTQFLAQLAVAPVTQDQEQVMQ
ncbi:hypothetical protein D5F01_LYC01217 [Larimichthys crocea]|uniref:Uncharacterized protein n=1 Tax=Larimichthys crocea TaxID=215358 RepID=A0A6G0JBU2_LARCR|nr:hypothetical protein D5F01_LYC01217 [Larimichthys crocea]